MISFLQGDVFDKLKELDDNSIDCVVTSPPYWGLKRLWSTRTTWFRAYLSRTHTKYCKII